MNTLGYVARQFDVLASAKPAVDGSDPNATHLPRVKSENWSSSSFLFPPALRTRRSKSSPSIPKVQHQPTPSPLTPPPTPPTSLIDPLPPSPRSKQNLESVINRIFFIRVVLVVWDHVKAVWSSVVEHVDALNALTWRRAAGALEAAAAAGVPSAKGKGRAVDGQDVNWSLELVEDPSSNSTSISIRYAASESSRSSTPIQAASGSGTPVLNAKKSPFHLPKTLVLDLDETLIHSTSRPIPSQGGSGWFGLSSDVRRNKGAGHMIEVVLGGRSTLYHVYKRPFVDFFLRTVSGWYTLVIFTASMQEYADPVIDWLDAGTGILTHRLFRDSCTQLPNGSYTKDLSIIEPDLSRVCLVDNSPVSYDINEANGIPIEGWTNDPYDEALLDLLPVLDSLRFTSDVRRVLGLRTAGPHHHRARS
ncbi:NLI interacting factor-like phosphatase-domain-containing protein [Ephemerocybe angulata]|uniref:NLI interacting factor-like phosphatase-domain-containing protein n=1 Tax=Ephemerocybe angulata TaxID=980116 RepID=A0A8H6MFT5_9AGAR|nr:NLI interacting factor-like phosphatase-domain-containing protein [Tulosesus angulatus]